MTTIAEMSRRFNSVNLRAEIPRIIQSDANELASYNKSQLYIDGIDSDSNRLREYSLNTVEYKRQKGQVFDHTTLFDTGSFYRQWVVQVSNDEISFNSTDSKTPKLENKYGSKIFGLTTKNKSLYSFGAFYDGVKKYITEKTGVRFV